MLHAGSCAADLGRSSKNNKPMPVRKSVSSVGHPSIKGGPEKTKRKKGHEPVKRTAFIVISVQKTKLHDLIVATVKASLKKYGITALCPADGEYMGELFANMHACDFGVAVFEGIAQDTFNPNVSLQTGYMLGMGKNMLLLKDSTLKSHPTDLAGALYKPFDPQAIKTTMPAQIEEWLKDKGLI